MCDNCIEALVAAAIKDGDYKKSETEMLSLLSNHPECSSQIALGLASLYANNGYKFKGTELLANLYKTNKDPKLLEALISTFSNIVESHSKENYNKNIQILQNRRFVYSDPMQTRYESIVDKPIWLDDKFLIAFVNGEIVRYEFTVYEPIFEENAVYMTKNEFRIKVFRRIHLATYKPDPMPFIIHPLYFYYDERAFNIFLQITDFKKISDCNRYVFIVGFDYLKMLFSDYQTLIPKHYWNINQEEVDFIHINNLDKINEAHNTLKRINEYYSSNKNKILDNIKSGRPKILFWTCLFTSALQNHIRDCMNECNLLGCEVGLVKERQEISRVQHSYIFEIDRLKPDIVFIIDYFRHEILNIIDEAFFVTWVQDLMPKFWNQSQVSMLRQNDFMLFHHLKWERFVTAGYNPERIMSVITTASDKIYKPRQLTQSEFEQYSCDICILGHVPTIETLINRFFESCDIKSANVKTLLIEIFECYSDLVYSQNIFYSLTDFVHFIFSFVMQKHVNLSKAFIDALADYMYIHFNNIVYKRTVVDWIFEAGFKNVKLWGNGWEHSKHSNYAMGPAKNGETLSKVYQASKVVLVSHPFCTTTTRTFESIFSGSFCLCNEMPDEHNPASIKEVLIENKEIVLYKNKDDLFNKLHYYLEHDDERKQIAERGRNKLLQTMTYSKLMERMLNWLAESAKNM